MGLGLKTGGGSDLQPFVKYDARAGRMFKVDRSQDATGTWVSVPVDITNTVQFVADMANVEVGWISFTDQGPTMVLVPLGVAVPERPAGTDKNGKAAFKQGFRLHLAMPKDQGGGVREFTSTAACVIEAIDELHDQFMRAPEGKASKLPVVKIANVMSFKSGQSTNYKPVFEIVAWVDRPASLIAAPAAATNGHAPAPVPQATTPPATGSRQAPPPAAQAMQAQQSTMTTGDFG